MSFAALRNAAALMAGLGALLSASALAEETLSGMSPAGWLDAMNESFSSLAYDGTFSYFNGGDLETLRVVHKEVDGVLRERLVHLNGPPREIVRTGDEVECFVNPGDELLAMEREALQGPFARTFTRQFAALSDSYSLSFYGEGRIAGRNAVRLAIQPRDDHRYGYRIWLDRDTHLLLRSEMVSSDQEFLEVFQFTSLVVGDAVPDSAVEPQASESSVVSLLRLDKPETKDVATEAVRWRAAWLPAGFAMAAADVRETSGHPVDTLMYTDGLVTFSVYVEALDKRGRSMVTNRGPTVIAMEPVAGPGEGPYLVTVVGDMPVATAQTIARNVRPTDE